MKLAVKCCSCHGNFYRITRFYGVVTFACGCYPELITDKDKEMLQNMMAYGKDAPPIKDTPKNIATNTEPEDEIDRFEEGSILTSFDIWYSDI